MWFFFLFWYFFRLGLRSSFTLFWTRRFVRFLFFMWVRNWLFFWLVFCLCLYRRLWFGLLRFLYLFFRLRNRLFWLFWLGSLLFWLLNLWFCFLWMSTLCILRVLFRNFRRDRVLSLWSLEVIRNFPPNIRSFLRPRLTGCISFFWRLTLSFWFSFCWVTIRRFTCTLTRILILRSPGCRCTSPCGCPCCRSWMLTHFILYLGKDGGFCRAVDG